MRQKPNNSKFTQSKVAEQITRQLSIILLQKVKDPRLAMININEVRLSRDSSYAKIYFTIIGDTDKVSTEKLLNGMAGFLRTELAAKLSMRHIPVLRFCYDQIADTTKHLDDLFEQIKKDPEN